MAILGGAATYAGNHFLGNVPGVVIGIASIIVAIIASIGAILFFFFRDPERQPPNDPGIIVVAG